MHSRQLYFWFLLIFCQLLNSHLAGQTAITQPPDTSVLIGYRQLFESIEKRDSVTIYYKSAWFKDRKINSAVSLLPLNEALSRVCNLSGLTYVLIDRHSVVFLPKESSRQPLQPGGLEWLVIGNPEESGKYTRATITGTISDGTSGEPLPGAIVSVDKIKTYAVTNRDGRFSLTLPVGEHNLVVKYVGYEDIAMKVRLVGDGNCNLDIFEKSVQLQAVVITDERADLNISRTRMSAFHLDAKTIRELPVSLGETDVIKSITLLPGIQSVGEFGSGYIVRGGNTDQNLVLVEDVPLFNSSHLFGLNSAINPDAISSVTLFKAGIPARYGERSSSVMAIRLGSSNDKTINVKGGIGLLNSRLTIAAPLFKRKANLLIGARSSYSDWLLHTMPSLDLQNSSAGFYDLNGLFTANMNNKNKLILFGYYSSDRFSFSRDAKYNYSNLLGSIRWNHIFSNKLSSGLMAGMSRYRFGLKELDTLQPYDANRIDLGMDYNNVKWIFNWFPNAGHSIEAGLNGILYRNSPGEMNPYGEESLVVPKKVQIEKGVEIAAFISDDFAISPRLSAEAGLRAVRFTSLGPANEFVYEPGASRSVETITDTMRYNENQEIVSYYGIEPRLALRFSIGEQRSVKLSFNRINQFISLLSNTSVISPTDSWNLSGTYFKPLVSDQVAAGYFYNIQSNSIETSVEIYFKKISNLPEYKNGAQLLLNGHLETELINANAYCYGAELFIKKNTGRMTGWISYSYSRAMEKTSGSSADEIISNNRYFSSNFDIPHNLVVNFNYHFTKRWRVSATFNYHTGRPITLPELKYEFNGNQLIWYSDRNKYRLPDYHRLDIAVTRDQSLRLNQKWKGSWTLSIVNLYGRRNAYSAYYAREDPRTWNYSGGYNLYKLYILGVPLPTITYNFTF